MKKISIIVGLVSAFFTSFSQHLDCGTSSYTDWMLKRNPEAVNQMEEVEKHTREFIAKEKSSTLTNSSL